MATALVTLGARKPEESPLGMLAACHGRIRDTIALTRRLAHERGHSLRDIQDAAERVRRYFSIALPLHIADEDLSIAPRLVHVSPVLEITLEVLAHQHRAYQPTIEWLVSLCERIEHHPEELESIRTMLAQTIDVIAAQFDTHLELEELVLFPAVGRLPPEEQRAIVAEIRARRA